MQDSLLEREGLIMTMTCAFSSQRTRIVHCRRHSPRRHRPTTHVHSPASGWALINLGMAHKQWAATGSLTTSMLLVNVFQLYYVVDALWWVAGGRRRGRGCRGAEVLRRSWGLPRC